MLVLKCRRKKISAIHAVSGAYYTSLAHNAAYSMIMNNMAMNSLVRNAGNIPFSGMRSLAAMENRLVMDNMNNSLMYRIANTMLENQRNAKKQKTSGLNLLA